jgi:hypothetical protein
MQLAPSIHRLGTSSLVNSYLVEDAGEITIVDAGLPGHWVLPGHGDAWSGGLTEALRLIRSSWAARAA